MTVPGGPAAAKAPAINGHHAGAPRSEAGNSPTPTTTSSKKEALTDAAESTAALAAIRIVEHSPSPSANPSPISRALTKRVKAITKKLQRIAQYEDLPPAQLNEDQKKAIASRSAQQAVLKELQEVAKALDDAEKSMKVEEEGRCQEERKRGAREIQAAADAQLLLIQQILRLFTLLHVPQLKDSASFASTTSSSFLDTITAQEAAAVGKLYQGIVEKSLYTGAEPAAGATGAPTSAGGAEEGSVQQLLSLVAKGSEKDEVLPGVSYKRMKDLLNQAVMPPTSAEDDAPKPPEASAAHEAKQDASGAGVTPMRDQDDKAMDEAKEVREMAPDLVEAAEGSKSNGSATAPPAGTSSSRSPAVGGISFLQSSDVHSTGANTPTSSAAVPVPEPEGGMVDSAMPTASAGEASQKGAEAGQGIAMGSQQKQETKTAEAGAAATPAVATPPARFDWSADVEGDDDLGDPMEAFPDSAPNTKPPAVAVVAAPAEEDGAMRATGSSSAAAVASPLQKKDGDEPATPPLTAAKTSTAAAAPTAAASSQRGLAAARERTTSTASATSTTPAKSSSASLQAPRPPQHQQQPTPSARKGPIVDSDGFVLQTSKRTQHLQQLQQQQQQQQGSRGGGRGGRGRGGRVGRAGANMMRGDGGRSGEGGEGQGGEGRGRGRARGGARGGSGGRGGAAPAGA